MNTSVLLFQGALEAVETIEEGGAGAGNVETQELFAGLAVLGAVGKEQTCFPADFRSEGK